MAEFVQLRKEKWVDPVNALRKLGILRMDECLSLVSSINNHEYKIQTPNRTLDDVLGYVQFLCGLLKAIQRKRKLIEQFEKTEEIDRFVYNEIVSQFGSAEINFGHKIAFWNARFKFVATVVPELDRENEFQRMFQKALKYCTRGDLNFYKYCVEFQWSLLKLPPARHPADKNNKKRKMVDRRDCSKYMSAIRSITMEAQRNFARSVEAAIWIITTELKYLAILKEEEAHRRDGNERTIQFDIDEETEKTDKLIQVLYQSFTKRHQDPMSYCQLFEKISIFSCSQAKLLSKTVFRHILTISPRPIEVSSWLITKCVSENKIDECLERVNQALSSNSKIKVFEMCLEKLLTFLQKLTLSDDPNYKACLSKLIQFSMKFFDPENYVWGEIVSEVYLTSRIQFAKLLSTIIEDKSGEGLEDELSLAVKTYLEKHPLKKIIRTSVKQCPSSFFLVKERVYQLLSQLEKKPVKPLVIFSYLSGINWKTVDNKEAHSFVSYIYRVFKTSPRLKKKLDKLLKQMINHSVMDQFRILHLKLSYLEDVNIGRNFYMSCSQFSSDWRFACAVLEIEKDKCRKIGVKAPSQAFIKAVEDAQRLGGTSSTEPWKIGVSALRAIGNEKEASRLLQRALTEFSSRKDLIESEGHKDLLLFSKSFKSSI